MARPRISTKKKTGMKVWTTIRLKYPKNTHEMTKKLALDNFLVFWAYLFGVPGFQVGRVAIVGLFASSTISGTTKQPKEKVFGLDIPRTSRVIRADVPGQKLRAGPRNLGQTSIWVRTSMTRTRRGRP